MILVGLLPFGWMSTDLILPHKPLEFFIYADLLLHAIADKIINCSIRPDVDLQQVTTIYFPLTQVRFYKYLFITKHFAVFFTVHWLAPGVHSIGGHGPLKSLDVKRTVKKYRLASGIRDDLVSFCVVAFSVSATCAKLKDHISLISSGVVLECRFDDKKVLGNPISGGKSSCSSLFSENFSDATFTSLIFITASATSHFRFLCWMPVFSALSSVTRTLAISLLLKTSI